MGFHNCNEPPVNINYLENYGTQRGVINSLGTKAGTPLWEIT